MSARGTNRRLARAGDPVAIARRKAGDQARRRGHGNGHSLGRLLGATQFRRGSNECLIGDQRMVLKSTSVGNHLITVTLGTLARVDAVVAAFGISPGLYEVLTAPIALCEAVGRYEGRHRIRVTRGAMRRWGRRLGLWHQRENRFITEESAESCTRHGSNVRIRFEAQAD